ncbi:Nucleoid-associated protein YgaU, contains BON and LysM domains [Methylobacterium phyllostachyos]|uniref:Nucleoid-associated protein YgaU, contains BON and LysM domains n=1 Tax=Methylobacterium phyllostachyos TaxID=582672 RepID=A0A1H0C520_9HYPH|nr:Ig-like domain-containing protein [Methylobacterium phyllostachyos]SDN52939.1 Nucleoid-associated protein YgaU, contains BON and LysM domains [Methylobacterium phyllostachyos]
MLTGLRRILVTALLSAFVGIGVILALLGRRPRKQGAGSVEELVPIADPSPAAGKATRGWGLAILLLLIGLTGIVVGPTDRPRAPKPPPTDGDRNPLAALSSPITDTGRALAPHRETPTGSDPVTGPEGPAPSDRSGSTVPSFDIVRIEPSGDAVIAGRAAPGSTVAVLVDGRPVASVRAGADGQFAVTPPPVPAGASEIGLRAANAAGTAHESAAKVAVVVAPSRDTRPLVALTAPNTPTVVLSQPDRPAARRPRSVIEPVKPAPLGAGPVRGAARAPGLDVPKPGNLPGGSEGGNPATDARAGGSGPGGAAASPATPPRVVSIDARDGGGLFVTARAGSGASLRLYLNDTLIAPATVGRDGTVTFAIGRGVRPGAYRVRLDLVDPATGTVQARAEVPFSLPDREVRTSNLRQKQPREAARPDASGPSASGDTEVRREPPAAPSDSSSTGSLAGNVLPQAEAGSPEVSVPGIATARIVRGDNLWTISRRTYGEGERYTLIYDANHDQIRDPDLIYPGQILVLPSPDAFGTESAGKRD